MTSITPHTTTAQHRKKHSLNIDMTPLVDLGFLLISFFIFTTTLSQPAVTRLIMPKDGVHAAVAARNSLTFLLAREAVYVYGGEWATALLQNRVHKTDYDLKTGMGKFIRQKQKALPQQDKLVVMLKPLQAASYQQVIAALDEMQINRVSRYAIMDITESEVAFVQNQ